MNAFDEQTAQTWIHIRRYDATTESVKVGILYFFIFLELRNDKKNEPRMNYSRISRGRTQSQTTRAQIEKTIKATIKPPNYITILDYTMHCASTWSPFHSSISSFELFSSGEKKTRTTRWHDCLIRVFVSVFIGFDFDYYYCSIESQTTTWTSQMYARNSECSDQCERSKSTL